MADKQQPPTTGEYDNPALYRDAGDGSSERVVRIRLERWNPDILEWEKWTGAAGGGGMEVHGNEYHEPDFEELGVAAGLMTTHEGAGDPHPGYLTPAEHTTIGDGAPHHARYTDAEAVIAAKTVKLDDFTAPDDNTDLDASTSKHGLLPKLGGGTANFLRADGAWAEPPGGGALDLDCLFYFMGR